MRITTAQNLRKIRDESKQPSEIYGKVIDVDYLNKSVLVQIGSKATWVQVVSSLLLGTKQNPIVVPGGQVQLVRWSGDEYVAARYVAVSYLPTVGVGLRMSAPTAYLNAPSNFTVVQRGTQLQAWWNSVAGASSYEIYYNTVPSTNGASLLSGMPIQTTTWNWAVDAGSNSNIITNNPGFESGDFTGYTALNDGQYALISSSQKYTGLYSAAFIAPEVTGDGGSALAVPTIQTDFYPVNESTVYKSSFAYKIVSLGTDGSFGLRLFWWQYIPTRSEEGLISSSAIFDTGSTTVGWVLLPEVSVTSPAGANYVTARFGTYKPIVSTGTAEAYIDDLSINGAVGTPNLLYYAVRAIDPNGNSSPFSEWKTPTVQSSTLGNPTSTHTQLDYANARIQSSNYAEGTAGYRVSSLGVEGACVVAASAPSTPFAGMLWFDTSTNIFKIWTP